MKALVTGGAGFIGSHLVDLLLSEGHSVVVLDDLSGGWLKNLEKSKDNENLFFHNVDIASDEDFQQYFQGVDWVFHFAAKSDIVPSIENPKEYYKTNVDGTFNILEAAKSAKVKRFIYAASSSCYGIAEEYPTLETSKLSPEYPYALTKKMGEDLVMHWAKLYDLPAISLRLFNVYGPRARTTGAYGAVFGVFLKQKLQNKPFTVVGDGFQSRDFTYVTDVARAFYAAAKSNISNEIFNVGSGGHYTVNELVNILGGDVTYIPKRPGEPDITFADTTKILKSLDWHPQISFQKGVKILLESIADFKDAPLWDPETIKAATKSWFKYLGKNKEQKLCSKKD